MCTWLKPTALAPQYIWLCCLAREHPHATFLLARGPKKSCVSSVLLVMLFQKRESNSWSHATSPYPSLCGRRDACQILTQNPRYQGAGPEVSQCS